MGSNRIQDWRQEGGEESTRMETGVPGYTREKNEMGARTRRREDNISVLPKDKKS